MTELDSLIKQVQLVVVCPSLNDTASDLERLKKSLVPLVGNHPLQASLAALRDLGPGLREG